MWWFDVWFYDIINTQKAACLPHLQFLNSSIWDMGFGGDALNVCSNSYHKRESWWLAILFILMEKSCIFCLILVCKSPSRQPWLKFFVNRNTGKSLVQIGCVSCFWRVLMLFNLLLRLEWIEWRCFIIDDRP